MIVARHVAERGRPAGLFARLIPTVEPTPTTRVGVAVLTVVIASLARWALDPFFGESAPWGAFIPATLCASLMGGSLAAIVSLSLSIVAGRVFFVAPRWTFLLAPAAGYIPLITFAGVAALVSAIALALRRTINTLRQHEEQLRELYQQAEQAREQAETALEAVGEADRRKDEFLAMLAHELRNPLAPIRNAVEVMRTMGLGEPALQRARDVIDRQLIHMTRLVDDLLEVSRITRGKIALEKDPLTLSAVVEEAIETARPTIDDHEHSLAVTLAREVIRLDGDRARLVQVVANLLSNAAKFTPRGGYITVETAWCAPDRAAIKVRDTGIGIPAELQQRVFDLFVQEESTLARSQGGLGIGLTLVQRLVALHGGTVQVTSEGRGRGSEFTVLLPAYAPAAVLESVEPPPLKVDATGPLRLLIVEDNTDTAETFEILLALHGHEVRVAHHGVQALRLLDEFVPHVALIDLGLPEMSGFELARRFRADPRAKATALVAVTGYGRDEDKQEAQEAGFDHHLTKPVEFHAIEALLAVLARALRSGQVAGLVQ
jgi:signal transduction histidine kinase/ActR/RegA family two-component response regulator